MARALPPTVALVLHYRDAARTATCLDSIARDGIRRALVVDNSADGGASRHELMRHVDTWRGLGLEVEAVDAGANLGFSAGVNLGLARISGRHGCACVLLLNSDATLRQGAHAALRGALEAGLEAASAWMLCASGERIGPAYYQPHGALVATRPLPGAFRYLSACCMLLGPALSAGPVLDEDFFFYGEDIELGWRLSRDDIPHAPVPSALVDHEGSASSRNGSLFYEYHMAMAHLRLPGKLARGRTELVGMYLGRLVLLPLRATMRCVRSASLAPWRGLLLAASDLARRRTRTIHPGGR